MHQQVQRPGLTVNEKTIRARLFRHALKAPEQNARHLQILVLHSETSQAAPAEQVVQGVHAVSPEPY